MSSTRNFLTFLANELKELADPLVKVVGDDHPPHQFLQLLDQAGWSIPDIGSDEASAVGSSWGAVVDSIDALNDGFDIESLARFASALEEVGGAMRSLAHLEDELAALIDVDESRRSELADELKDDVFHYLVASYFRRRWPVVHDLLYILGIFRIVTVEALYTERDGRGYLLRRGLEDGAQIAGGTRRRLHPAGLLDLLEDPAGTLKGIHLPDGLSSELDAQTFNVLFFGRLRPLLESLGGGVFVGPLHPTRSDLTSAEADEDFRTTALEMKLPSPDGSLVVPRLAVTVTVIPSGVVGELGHEGPGFELTPNSSFDLSATSGLWTLDLQVPVATRFFVGPGGFAAEGDTEGLDASLTLTRDGDETVTVLGASDGSRLEIGIPVLKAWISADENDLDFGFDIRSAGSRLVVGTSDPDGFLGALLPVSGVDSTFDLGVSWSKQSGLHLSGGAGLQVRIPVALGIANGTIEVPWLDVEVDVGEDGVQVGLAANVSLEIGPIAASIEGVGLLVNIISRSDLDGDLGPYDLGLSFKPPTGLGLALDTGLVSGGGYLSFDADEERYAGLAEVNFANLGLQATGIITTQLPDGSDGWSFIIMISANFGAVPIGFGFFLEAVGGLFGYNRSVDTDVLQDGIKEGTLDSVLFPDDPVADAPQIISDLEAVFPTTEDQYVFGPMARIGWPSPSILDVDLSIVIEAPDPFRVLILGQISGALPQAEPLVELHFDVLGVLDLDEGTLSIDAALYDSYVALYALSGGMALRLGWGDNPQFALAVGGFHPGYQPPSDFPALERVGVALDIDNPRISLEGYLAVTSNSVQFGAALEIYASAVGFTIEGEAGFDVLVVFSPFGFEASLFFGVSVKAGKITLVGVDLELLLAGPKPWEVEGKATFKVLLLEHSFRVDLTLPPKGEPANPDPVDVESMLTAAIADSKNWISPIAADSDPGISFLDTFSEDDTVTLHPSGGLEFRQTVVPLGVEIDVYSDQPIDGVSRFDLEFTAIGEEESGADEDATSIEDWFAPGQYFEMSDTEELESPDYELMQAGIGVSVDVVANGEDIDAEFDYETAIYDPEAGESSVITAGFLSAGELLHFACSSATAKARTSRMGATRFKAEGVELRVADTAWAVASASDMTPVSAGELDSGTSTTFVQALRAKGENGDSDSLQVIPTHELLA